MPISANTSAAALYTPPLSLKFKGVFGAWIKYPMRGDYRCSRRKCPLGFTAPIAIGKGGLHGAHRRRRSAKPSRRRRNPETPDQQVSRFEVHPRPCDLYFYALTGIPRQWNSRCISRNPYPQKENPRLPPQGRQHGKAQARSCAPEACLNLMYPEKYQYGDRMCDITLSHSPTRTGCSFPLPPPIAAPLPLPVPNPPTVPPLASSSSSSVGHTSLNRKANLIIIIINTPLHPAS